VTRTRILSRLPLDVTVHVNRHDEIAGWILPMDHR